MPTTTAAAPLLRIEHAELCASCRDLLPAGSVVVTGAGAATCLACAEVPAPLRVVRTDAWSVLDDPELRTRLHLRRHATPHPFALSA